MSAHNENCKFRRAAAAHSPLPALPLRCWLASKIATMRVRKVGPGGGNPRVPLGFATTTRRARPRQRDPFPRRTPDAEDHFALATGVVGDDRAENLQFTDR